MTKKAEEIIELVGKTISSIDGTIGGDEIKFHLSDGRTLVMYHDQSCCEDVFVEDICGDFKDLIGTPVVLAEEVSNSTPIGIKDRENVDSFTWTFYTIGTNRGRVVIRWYGTSNGYYSERVDLKWE